MRPPQALVNGLLPMKHPEGLIKGLLPMKHPQGLIEGLPPMRHPQALVNGLLDGGGSTCIHCCHHQMRLIVAIKRQTQIHSFDDVFVHLLLIILSSIYANKNEAIISQLDA